MRQSTDVGFSVARGECFNSPHFRTVTTSCFEGGDSRSGAHQAPDREKHHSNQLGGYSAESNYGDTAEKRGLGTEKTRRGHIKENQGISIPRQVNYAQEETIFT